MKAHQSQYFPIVLQLCSLFKCSAKQYQGELHQSIRLMSIDELYANIMHSAFETTLMKEIIKFLLSKVGDTTHFLQGPANQFLFFMPQKISEELRQQYYMQMALQQYFIYTGNTQKCEDYCNMYTFYGLDTDLKFQILKILAERVMQMIRKTKTNRKDQENGKQTKKQQQGQKSKADKIPQILILGQDNESLYLFAPFLPEYVLQTNHKKWYLLNKIQVIQKIRHLLKQQMSTNNLFLIENLSTTQKDFMFPPSEIKPHIRIHKVKENNGILQDRRFSSLKRRLQEIQRRYSYFLKNFRNRCWGYLNQRKQYDAKFVKSSNFSELIDAFQYFYQCSNKFLLICQSSDQAAIPQTNYKQYYKTQSRPTCNINTVFVASRSNFSGLSSLRLSNIIFNQKLSDVYAMFQLNVCILQIAIKMLENKQEKYFQKQARRIAHEEYKKQQKGQQKMISRLRSRPQRKSESVSEQSREQEINNRPQLRQRKTKKMYGVTLIDSDEQSFSVSRKSDCQFKRYEYPSRSALQR